MNTGPHWVPCFVSKYSKYLLTGSRVLCFQTDSPWAIQVYGNLLLWIVYRWTSRLSGTSAVPLNPGNKTANVSQHFISLLLLKILFHQGLFFQSARSGPDCPRWIKINSSWLSSWPRPRWPWADSFWLVTGYSSRSLFRYETLGELRRLRQISLVVLAGFQLFSQKCGRWTPKKDRVLSRPKQSLVKWLFYQDTKVIFIYRDKDWQSLQVPTHSLSLRKNMTLNFYLNV